MYVVFPVPLPQQHIIDTVLELRFSVIGNFVGKSEQNWKFGNLFTSCAKIFSYISSMHCNLAILLYFDQYWLQPNHCFMVLMYTAIFLILQCLYSSPLPFFLFMISYQMVYTLSIVIEAFQKNIEIIFVFPLPWGTCHQPQLFSFRLPGKGGYRMVTFCVFVLVYLSPSKIS